jgi:hypothetical protein
MKMKYPILISKRTKPSRKALIDRTSFAVRILITLMLCVLFAIGLFAHPGSGIVLDKEGNIYFTDTGKGVWKIDTEGKLSFLPASKFHWMTIDANGNFAGSPKSFGGYFERVTSKTNKPDLICVLIFRLLLIRTETSTMLIPGQVRARS